MRRHARHAALVGWQHLARCLRRRTAHRDIAGPLHARTPEFRDAAPGGLEELVARDEEDYVRLAIRLAADRNWRAAIGARVRAGAQRLFDDPAPVAALESFWPHSRSSETEAVDASLWALFASAFVSATILPGNSEIVLVAVLKSGTPLPAAVAVATLGNTVGGLTTYGLGRLLPSRVPEGAAVARVRRYGAAVLFLSWLPFVGDALCAAAGWLRLPWPLCTLAIAAGKFIRYVAVAQAATLI